ncbi:hypothetical protein WMF20_31540 [Sorangium sp. So ce834]|uniref:hypothetical protein n=1 Tax=Sorangium sp. So ce834 TaxID=3133321 RepID=UPI003F647B10
MKIVQQHIVRHQEQFSDHPFFARLSTDPPFERLAPFPVCLMFFVMTFQDILRICDERATDPEYKRVVHRHRLEDAGHDRWFLGDLAALGLEPPTAAELFGERHRAARTASLALLSDAVRARHDAGRLTLLLTLESAGHVFFERVARYLVRIGERRRLRYFSQTHLDVERAHDVFEEDTDARIEAIALDEEARTEALQLIERCYRELTGMFDAIEAQVAAGAARPALAPSRPRPVRGAALRVARTPVPRPFARRAPRGDGGSPG